MPASSCTDPIVLEFSVGNGAVDFRVELKWNGTSTPPNCDGTVNRVAWTSTSTATWYAHLPAAKGGPAVYRIDAGASGAVTARNILHAGGFDTRADVNDNLDVNQVPPQPGERLLN